MVRLMILEPSREDSRRRMAGGELRLATVSTYMGTTYHIIMPDAILETTHTWVHKERVRNAYLIATQRRYALSCSQRRGELRTRQDAAAQKPGLHSPSATTIPT